MFFEIIGPHPDLLPLGEGKHFPLLRERDKG
jgi:hypothetical protein